jgi:hypothetical protein
MAALLRPLMQIPAAIPTGTIPNIQVNAPAALSITYEANPTIKRATIESRNTHLPALGYYSLLI